MSVDGTVSATGSASSAIFAESAGQGASLITVTVHQGGFVSGGTDFSVGDGYGAGVYLVGGGTTLATANVVDNSGVITSIRGDVGTAIYGTQGYTTVNNSGSIIGSVNLGNGGGTATIENTGRIVAGSQINLGARGKLDNEGTLAIGAGHRIATTTIVGNLDQGARGHLVVDTDHAKGASDLLVVKGNADLAGTIDVNAESVANRPVTVLTASGDLTVDPGLATTRANLFRSNAERVGSNLVIKPVAEFAEAASGLGANQRSVAAHLQHLWDSGADLGIGFTALAGIGGVADYASALSSVGGETAGTVAASATARAMPSSPTCSTNARLKTRVFGAVRSPAMPIRIQASMRWATRRRHGHSRPAPNRKSRPAGPLADRWPMKTARSAAMAVSLL